MTPEQELYAAVLWAGPLAVASHESAAWLWGLRDQPPGLPSVTTSARRAPQPAVDLHEARTVAPGHVVRRGIRCTTLPRTLCDCACGCSAPALRNLLDRAVADHATLIPVLERQLAPGGELAGRPGAAQLRRAMRAGGYGGRVTRTVLESHMRRALLDAGVEGLVAEVRLTLEGVTWSFDYGVRDLMLLWEAQSDAHHSSPSAQRRDSRKANAASRAGWTLRCYTWFDLEHDRARVVAEMAADYRAALARQAPTKSA